jgi:AcrR family transcriptional regulator
MTFSSETELKILNTAESLFAEFGLHGVSLRKLTSRARVNLAAVNYHYYDKDSLYREILIHRLREINAIRLSELQYAEARAAGSPVPLAEIFQIMARPMFFSGSEPSKYNSASRRLLGRIFTDPLPFASEILSTELQPVMTRFGQAIRRHNPSLSPEDFIWRLSFIVGAMHHAFATMHAMNSLTNGICRNDDAEAALRNFTSLAVCAFESESR